MSFIKLRIVLCLLAILLSLGAAMYHMVSDQGKSLARNPLGPDLRRGDGIGNSVFSSFQRRLEPRGSERKAIFATANS